MQPDINSIAAAAQSTSNNLLTQILSELKKSNNTGKPWIYISDVITVADTVTTEAEALASPALTITTPPQPIYLNTLAFAWDNNTQNYYKWYITIQGVSMANGTNFKLFPAFTNELDIFNDNVIPLPANAAINLYIYNYNSGTVPSKSMVYLLGFMQQ